jgi:predicted dehydrogenase
MSIGVGLYGMNGHQVHGLLARQPLARLLATAAFQPAALPPEISGAGNVRHYATLPELLADPAVELVSLCSPRRRDQAADAIACLQAGKHVYAEKPCAMTEADLDRILSAADAAGRQFHEMAGTAFEQPYLGMRQVVQSGAIGTVVQVLAQKSYPYYDGRAQDEDLDGGLIGQNAIHAVRFVEHVAGIRIASVTAIETRLGNPRPAGGLRMAAVLMFTLENGGVGSIVANYLNPHPAFGSWGNEHLRIFGTRGMLEAVDAGQRTRLVLADRDAGAVDTTAPSQDYFGLFLAALSGRGDMPLSLADELHPTRVVIRAKAAAAAAAAH